MKGKTLGILLAMMMVSVAFVGLAATVRADDRYVNDLTLITLTSNNYPGGVPSDWYYPGDAITGTLEGRPIGGLTPPADGAEDVFDVVAADDDGILGCDPILVLTSVRLSVDNVGIDPVTGKGTFSFPGSVTQYLPDGYYCAWVAPSDYLQSGPTPPYRGVSFQIHEYRISAYTDKSGYIPGNKVTVFYMVSKIKDGSPMTMTGYLSNWLVQSTPAGETYAYGQITTATGKFEFTISNTGGTTPPESYPIYIWFNSTGGGAVRKDAWTLSVSVGNIAVNIQSPVGTPIVAPDSLFLIDVRVEAVIPGPNPGYPGASVLIKILDGPTPASPELPAFTKTYTTDNSGSVRYAFMLDPAVFLDGKTYTVSANATSILKWSYDTEAFKIQESIETMSVRLTLDKLSYYSDETVVMTVASQPPSGHSQPSTYVYEVYSSSGNLYALESSSASPYQFHIPADLTGTLYFRVDAYNVEGDYGWDEEARSITYGYLILNVRPFEYNANDLLTISFELRSTILTPSATSFYYMVSDGVRVVEQGPANAVSGTLAGTFTYQVSGVPASYYAFYVYASGGGHVVSNSVSANLIQNFILTIEFNSKTYKPDETMNVKYTLTPRVSTTPLPRTFRFSYALSGHPTVSFMTTEASGEVQYVVPRGANEGITLFTMSESMTSTTAVEVVTIGPPPAEIGGIEIFDLFLLVLVVILFLLMLAMRGRGAGAGAPPKVKEEKAAPPPPPGQQASPMVVNCKSCGAPIEITTSKRPIEVMCPSCGETAMVQ